MIEHHNGQTCVLTSIPRGGYAGMGWTTLLEVRPCAKRRSQIAERSEIFFLSFVLGSDPSTSPPPPYFEFCVAIQLRAQVRSRPEGRYNIVPTLFYRLYKRGAPISFVSVSVFWSTSAFLTEERRARRLICLPECRMTNAEKAVVLFLSLCWFPDGAKCMAPEIRLADLEDLPNTHAGISRVVRD